MQDVIDRAVSYILTSIDLSRLDGTSRSLASIAYALSLLPDRTLQGANLMDKLIYYVLGMSLTYFCFQLKTENEKRSCSKEFENRENTSRYNESRKV